MEIIPTLKKLRKDWDLRGLVLLSLTLQVVLIVLGNRRKFVHRHWIRFVVWSAYLAADYVATCALGLLSKSLATGCGDNAGSVDAKIELTALWAPFLLLHLGGPDTITAYALEDNELWLRHLLGLVSQTAVALYIFVVASKGSHLSILFILLFLAGLVKYGERTWVLRSACETGSLSNNDKFGNSDSHGFSASSTKFDMEKDIKENQGYRVAVHRVIEMRHRVDPAFLDADPISDKEILLTAHDLLNLTQNFLLDAVLSYKDNKKTVFRNMSSKNAFKVIESDGLLYDLLYTKSPLLYTSWGLVLRLITVFLTCSAFVFFTFLDQKHKYSEVDVYITFLLLSVAIILEIYAALVQLSSDRFAVWLGRHNKKTSTLQALHSVLSFYKSPKWSNNMCQFSFLNFCMRVKSLPCHNMMKLLTIVDKNLESKWLIDYQNIPEKLKDSIFCHVKSKAKGDHLGPSSITDFWVGQEDIVDYPKFWEELVNGILFWHIFTEVVLQNEFEGNSSQEQIDANLIEQNRKLSKQISRYMLYLLVLHPSMLSARIDQIISFKRIFDQAADILEGMATEREACQKLIKWHDKLEKSGNRTKEEDEDEESGNGTKEEDEESKTESLKSPLLYNAVGCAKRVTPGFEQDTWKKLCETWLDILTFAARKTKGKQHSQQLSNDGELLTHVWLLMSHFGLTDNFTSQSHQVVRLTAH